MPQAASLLTKSRKQEEGKPMSETVNGAMIGLGFGAEFLPIYAAHPNANISAICRRNGCGSNGFPNSEPFHFNFLETAGGQFSRLAFYGHQAFDTKLSEQNASRT